MDLQSLGTNVVAAFDPKSGKILIEIDTKAKATPSKSGKSMILSTTSGFAKLRVGDRTVQIGLNVLA